MDQQERCLAGRLFAPGDPELVALKLRAHRLSQEYSACREDDPRREEILAELLGAFGPDSFIQGPVFFHYGCHTRIGARFFANYNLVIQDDGEVEIGDDCSFGPNVTIVTPLHPMLPEQRRRMLDEDGTPRHLCWAKPVRIGSDCWLGANVVVCSGVTIGDGCVIGAGSVVCRDIPAGTFAAGNPCRVIRVLGPGDSMEHKPQALGNCRVE